MENFFEILGQNIKNVREEKGLTLDELAQRTGIRKQYLAKIEKGNAPGMTTKQLLAIAEALEVHPTVISKGL